MISNAEFSTIAALDLESIKVKLMQKESGEGWSPERANAVEFEYRRFLYLMKLFPHEQTAPLVDVDIFWHNHILDTIKYAADCAQVFGYFLHHVPDSGARDEAGAAVHERTGARMQELYEATFGEGYARRLESQSWCQPAMPAAAWCQPATPQAAWCQPAKPEGAWCQPATAKTAWCQPAAPKAAWCQPAAPKAAWCQPATPAAAWCQPTIAKAAWCQPAITARSAAAAPNDRLAMRAVLAEAA